MINKIRFKFGATEGQPPLALDVTPITVFVGPNNSGKSRVLIEIEKYCRTTIGQPNDLVLGQLELDPYTQEEIESELDEIEQEPLINEHINANHIIVGKLNPQNNSSSRVQITKQPPAKSRWV